MLGGGEFHPKSAAHRLAPLDNLQYHSNENKFGVLSTVCGTGLGKIRKNSSALDARYGRGAPTFYEDRPLRGSVHLSQN